MAFVISAPTLVSSSLANSLNVLVASVTASFITVSAANSDAISFKFIYTPTRSEIGLISLRSSTK